MEHLARELLRPDETAAARPRTCHSRACVSGQSQRTCCARCHSARVTDRPPVRADVTPWQHSRASSLSSWKACVSVSLHSRSLRMSFGGSKTLLTSWTCGEMSLDTAKAELGELIARPAGGRGATHSRHAQTVRLLVTRCSAPNSCRLLVRLSRCIVGDCGATFGLAILQRNAVSRAPPTRL